MGQFHSDLIEPLVALAGILILVRPALLRAIYLILIGALGLSARL